MNGWPDHFDIREENETTHALKNFIDEQVLELKAFDEKREQWVKTNMPPRYHMTYRFYDHTLRVAADIKATTLHMGLSERVAENMYWAMLPHDIGKTLLPVNIWDMLEKPGDDIKRLRRSHTELGPKIMPDKLKMEHPFIDLICDIMLNHHEQMNGQGYRGVKGEDLSLPVRLAAIVEGFDGWSIRRPHFGARDVSVPGVLKRMREEKGAAMFDMELFEAFAEMKMKNHNNQKIANEHK